MLHVTDVERSIAFYTGLGFELRADHRPEPEGPRNWALLRLGEVDLMLNAGGRSAQPGERRDAVCFVYTADVDALYAALTLPEGTEPPEDHWTGLRQFLVCDPDGFELWFATVMGPKRA